MALTFTEQFRGDIGGKRFAAYRVEKDGTITSMLATDFQMTEIESCMAMESTTQIINYFRMTTEAGISKIEFGTAGTSGDHMDVWVIGW